MSKLTLAKFAAVLTASIGAVALGTAGAAATPTSLGAASASSPMPMSGQLRACDSTALKWAPNPGVARPVAHVGTNGSGTIVATVDIDTAQPDTLYAVRVVQTPRPSSGCAAGAPGVLSGGLQTDAAGVGHVTIQGPVAAGATGAWVAVELPSGSSQTPAEFYTTEFIASI
jgi:hypothetical protein